LRTDLIIDLDFPVIHKKIETHATDHV